MALDASEEASPDTTDERTALRREMAQALARGGMEGIQIISHETVRTVLTPRRRELIGTLQREEAESVRDLARRVGRDKAQVSRDLAVLAEHGIVRFEEDGRAKRPYLTQQHVIPEPIV